MSLPFPLPFKSGITNDAVAVAVAVDIATIMRLQSLANLSVSFIKASALCLQANKCQQQTTNCKLKIVNCQLKPKLQLQL